ncbi:MAG: hypothetical protein HY057_12105 [Rhodospirillales bacterium]|nr:hypothetical protein [Rhodospirillales bacterium]
MSVKAFVSTVALAAVVAACSSIATGTSQQIQIVTDPIGAECKVNREGVVIAVVTSTPGPVIVDRTKHSLTIVCQKEGYEPTEQFVKSDIQAMTFGNILIGGGIGWAIDSASGADNKYDELVTVALKKK